MFFDRHRARPQDVADVAVDLALDHPVQHLGFAVGELEREAHGFNHAFVRHLTHDDEPVAATFAVTDLLVQAESQAFGAGFDAQAGRLNQHLGVGHVAAQPGQHRLRRLRRSGTVVAQQKVARQRGLPHQFAVAQSHRDAGIPERVQRAAGLAFFTCALQVYPHAGKHFLRLDGFGHVVHPTRLQRRHQVFGLGQAGHENDRNVGRAGRGLEPARHLKTVHARHHGIQQHDVGQCLRGTLQRGFTMGSHQYGVTRFVQRVV